MPRYYFPSWDGEVAVPDEEGLELAGPEAAQVLAGQALAEMAADVLPKARSGSRVLQVEVKDDQKKPVLCLSLTLNVEQFG